jgi:aspartate aminotransferase
MKFAHRVQGIEISGIRKIFEAAGPDSINLGLGQPDFDTPQHIKDAAIQAIQEGKTGYTNNTGIPELRMAIGKKLKKENGLSCLPDQIIVTAGASEALHIVMQALVDPGDLVLCPDPGFVSYASLATLAGGNPVSMPLTKNLHIDVEKAKSLMDGAKIIILNSPANPTGAVENKESIQALVEYASGAGVTVVSDEVYEHFIYGKQHWSAARFGENVVTINATSKTYAMTGWRLGYLAAPEEIVAQCVKVHQYCQACATSISPVCCPCSL